MVANRSPLPRRPLGPAAALLALALLPSVAAAQDRHYLWIFAAQSHPFCPAHAHTWAAFARVEGCTAPGGPPAFETFTISWMPATLKVRFHALQPEAGVNLDLLTSLRFVQGDGAHISVWGPYEITPCLYEAGRRQKDRLEGGTVRYRAIDPLQYSPGITECIHAVSDIDRTRSRVYYEETIRFGEAAGSHVAHTWVRSGWAWPACEDLCWLEQALGMDQFPLRRRR
jgi:hypothetical protein